MCVWSTKMKCEIRNAKCKMQNFHPVYYQHYDSIPSSEMVEFNLILFHHTIDFQKESPWRFSLLLLSAMLSFVGVLRLVNQEQKWEENR